VGTEDSLEGVWIDGGDLGGVDGHEAWASLKRGPIGGNDAESSDGGQKLELIQIYKTQKPMLRVEGQGACGWALFLGDSTGSLCYFSLFWGNSSSSRTSRPVNITLLFLDNDGRVRSSQAACGFVALSSWIACDQVCYGLCEWIFSGRVSLLPAIVTVVRAMKTHETTSTCFWLSRGGGVAFWFWC
jgi:hypothetical protein